MDYSLICSRCVMDSSAEDFVLTSVGCNFCDDFKIKQDNHLDLKSDIDNDRQRLNAFVSKIKSRKPRDSKYDCIIGLSGGLDSVFSLHLATTAGLDVLAVHMDNGWNSNLAQINIENIVTKTSTKLITNVISWTEYRDLQKAFFMADVLDIEMLYDQAVYGTLFKVARENNVRTIIAGTNQATEGFAMPSNFAYSHKLDSTNVLDIWARYGSRRSILTYPFYSMFDNIFDMYGRGIRWASILDTINYSKSEAVRVLTSEYGFIPYPYKHYESFFTRFYQGYLLPRKFGIDKRKVHLSNLIMSGDLSREEALKLLKEDPYHTDSTLENDITYFLKKMGFEGKDLEDYLKRPPVPHSQFKSDQNLLSFYHKIFKAVRFLNQDILRLMSSNIPFIRKKSSLKTKNLMTSSIEERMLVKELGARIFIILTLWKRFSLKRKYRLISRKSIN